MNPGADAVHADALVAELDRHRPGELQHAAFRRVVVGELLLAAERVGGCHVHDRTTTTLAHDATGDRLPNEEHPTKVHSDRLVPLHGVDVEEPRLAAIPALLIRIPM
jgi:hypothetical protein